MQNLLACYAICLCMDLGNYFLSGNRIHQKCKKFGSHILLPFTTWNLNCTITKVMIVRILGVTVIFGRIISQMNISWICDMTYDISGIEDLNEGEIDNLWDKARKDAKSYAHDKAVKITIEKAISCANGTNKEEQKRETKEYYDDANRTLKDFIKTANDTIMKDIGKIKQSELNDTGKKLVSDAFTDLKSGYYAQSEEKSKKMTESDVSKAMTKFSLTLKRNFEGKDSTMERYIYFLSEIEKQNNLKMLSHTDLSIYGDHIKKEEDKRIMAEKDRSKSDPHQTSSINENTYDGRSGYYRDFFSTSAND